MARMRIVLHAEDKAWANESDLAQQSRVSTGRRQPLGCACRWSWSHLEQLAAAGYMRVLRII